MQEWKIAYVNRREVPVLISDEKEALLAAKAAGRVIVGLWRPEQPMDEISAADYVVERQEDVSEAYLERIARRHLGMPWEICETERLLIRELCADDFDEVWMNQIGLGFGSAEELRAYTKHQYRFYEFGFWALVKKKSGELVGVAGLKVPEGDAETKITEDVLKLAVVSGEETEEDTQQEILLELGYHLFVPFRKNGYAKEACRAILEYGVSELGATEFMVRIDKENIVSRHLAESLGFLVGN